MHELSEQRLPFTRLEVSLEEAIAKVTTLNQPYKVELLETIRDRAIAPIGAAEQDELKHEVDPAAERASFYTTGDFVDLCRGPHVLDTSVIRFFRLTHLAGAYWRGDERRPMLTRIYGIASRHKMRWRRIYFSWRRPSGGIIDAWAVSWTSLASMMKSAAD